VTNVLRTPVVLFAYVVDLLRRLPGSGPVGRRLHWLVRALLIASGVSLLLWLSTPTPQRISLSDLAAGKLSPMQSWIIVSGELGAEPDFEPEWHRYRLTDPAAPGASMIVRSTVPLGLGSTTISGHLEGGRDIPYISTSWVGALRADATLAHEIPPPWTAAGLALGGLLVIVARRTSYPMFFHETPGAPPGKVARVPVTLRRGAGPTAGRAVPATVVIGPGEPAQVTVVADGGTPLELRLHSALTSSAAGELRALGWSQPAIRLRQAAEDVILGFSTLQDRDAVHGLLLEAARARIAMAGARQGEARFTA
jgi:hypothetical protein